MDIFNLQRQSQNKTALITEDGKIISYGQLISYVKNVKEYIKSKSLVLILAKNNLESIVFYLSTFMSNSTVLLMGDNGNVQTLIELYHPRYIVKRKNAPSMFANYDVLYNFLNYDLLEMDVDYEVTSQIALLLSTSGSTGNPKCVKISWENLQANTNSIINSLGIKSSDIAITTLPFNYTYGLSIINTHLSKGATLILCNYSIVEKKFWDIFLKYKANNFGGVPYTYEILLKLNLINEKTMKNVRYLTQAGGKLDINKIKEMLTFAHTYGFKFLVMYGQTEATARMSYLPWVYSGKKVGSIGIPIEDGHFEIRDAEGRRIEKSHVSGELVYSGPNVSLGYSNNYEDLLTFSDDFNHVLYTGDMAYFDEEGFYYIVGRKKGFVKICGKRISLQDLEKILKVLEFNLILSGKDEQLYILINDSYNKESESKILQELKEKAGIYKNSVNIQFVNEFPRNEFGKIIYDVNKWISK